MAINFQNLKLELKRTRPVGYKYPAGLSFGTKGSYNAATETLSLSSGYVLNTNETTPAPAPSGPSGLEETDGTANTTMQWNSSGTFIPKFTGELEVLVVAGGGGSGHGGGGAGGLIYASNQPVTIDTTYNCLVGAGGIVNNTYSGGPPTSGTHSSGNIFGPNAWERGGHSSNIAEMPIVATGGGGGAVPASTSGDNSTYGWNSGAPGGSGGGGARGGYVYTSPGNTGYPNGAGGTGIAGQGNTGGTSRASAAVPNPNPSNPMGGIYGVAGGGGGAGEVGENGRSDNVGASGGDGLEYSISGSPVYYAGGGGGGGWWAQAPWAVPDTMTSTEGTGGQGGGGDGAYIAINGSPGGTPAHPYSFPVTAVDGTAGTINRGGGGGGRLFGNIQTPGASGTGGSGTIIIKFRTYQRFVDNYFID